MIGEQPKRLVPPHQTPRTTHQIFLLKIINIRPPQGEITSNGRSTPPTAAAISTNTANLDSLPRKVSGLGYPNKNRSGATALRPSLQLNTATCITANFLPPNRQLSAAKRIRN